MFKSLFKKLLFTYCTVLIFVMLVLSITITSFTDVFVYNQKTKILDNIAFKTSALANDMDHGVIEKDVLSVNIDSMGYITDTKIYIIKTSLKSVEQADLGEELEDPYLIDSLRKILRGETVYLRKQYSKGFEAQMIFAGYPWINDEGIKGAVLLFSPEKELSDIINRINRIIWITAAAFVLIGGTVIFFLSRRIVRPVKAIETASKKLAAGEDAEDVAILSKDEIGVLAESFNIMKSKIKKNERLRQDLIANISHDLRTPLTTINGYVKGLIQGIVKEEDKMKVLNIIQSETERLTKMTGEIIQAAKIQSGNIELKFSTGSLRDVIDKAVLSNRQAAKEKNIDIKIHCPKNLKVQVDFAKIELVFYNLINNAVKYSHEGCKVEIKAEQIENEVLCCVADNGKGIKKEDLPVIFERFYRADHDSAGYGLGLAIAKSYVESHKGRIWAESEPEKGTCFYFALPVL